jgi:hypothetical protein
MEQSKAMEYGSREASSDVLKPRNMYIGYGPVTCTCEYGNEVSSL